MKKLAIIAIAVEGAGITLLAIAIAEGMGNPGIYLSGLGGLLVVAGGFMWAKIVRRKR